MANKISLIDKIEDTIYSGADFTSSNSETAGEGATYSTNFSPNNLKTVILSQEGVILAFHTTDGNTVKQIRRVNFPTSQDTFNDLLEGKEIFGFLIGKRVFSSVEEIVIIKQSGQNPEFGIPKRQIDFLRNKVLQRLNRLSDVVLLQNVDMSLEEFQDYYTEILKTPTIHIGNDQNLQQYGATIIPVNKEWYNSISLRPAYYKLDEKDGTLAKKLYKVKEQIGQDGVGVSEEEEKKDEEPQKLINESSLKNEQELGYLFGMLNKYYLNYKYTPRGLTPSRYPLIQKYEELEEKYLQDLNEPEKLTIPHNFSDKTVKTYPELKDFKEFITVLNSKAGYQAKEDLDVNGLKDIRDFLVSYMLNSIKKKFYRNKSNTTSNKMIRTFDLAVHEGFLRRMKFKELFELKKLIKAPKSTEVNQNIVDQYEDLMMRPLSMTDGAISDSGGGSRDYSTTSYNDLMKYVNDDHEEKSSVTRLYWIMNRVDATRSDDRVLANNEKAIKNISFVIFVLRLEFGDTEVKRIGSMYIGHDFLNLQYKMGKEYYSKALSKVFGNPGANTEPIPDVAVITRASKLYDEVKEKYPSVDTIYMFKDYDGTIRTLDDDVAHQIEINNNQSSVDNNDISDDTFDDLDSDDSSYGEDYINQSNVLNGSDSNTGNSNINTLDMSDLPNNDTQNYNDSSTVQGYKWDGYDNLPSVDEYSKDFADISNPVLQSDYVPEPEDKVIAREMDEKSKGDKDTSDEVRKESEEISKPYHPNHDVKMFLAWLDRLTRVKFEQYVNEAVIQSNMVENLTAELKSFIDDSELEEFDKDTSDYIKEIIVTNLNQDNSMMMTMYLNTIKDYFDGLKSFQELNTGTMDIQNDWSMFFNSRGIKVKPEEMYLFPKELYYVLKGRVR